MSLFLENGSPSNGKNCLIYRATPIVEHAGSSLNIKLLIGLMAMTLSVIDLALDINYKSFETIDLSYKVLCIVYISRS